MKLLTKTIENSLPALYSQDGKGMDATVYVKYFCLKNNWRWYGTEYDPETKEFFGFVAGDFHELGYFSLAEFEEINAKSAYPIMEREIYFTKKPLKEALVADGYNQYKE